MLDTTPFLKVQLSIYVMVEYHFASAIHVSKYHVEALDQCVSAFVCVCICRLEAIAADAELQEKSMSELQRLMTVLHEGCIQAEDEHRAQ